ncbi:MAG TPA: carboxypeptidase regulatory-like domain-containing protein, partial [Candidatus Marinimicrobia bacterium]|nr:carboxypeptidase regulatory-like domain-containing protein [Candidatus Neomarinimicrobiota bacterium]
MKNLSIVILCTVVLMGQHQRGGSREMPAMGVLQGTVLDSSNNNPIEYASVSIINVRSDKVITGAVSDENGRFYISEIPLGKYKIMVEFIGYNKAIKEDINLFPGKGGGIEQNLGNIILSLSSVQMAGVDVIGELPQFIQTIDKKIFFVDQSLTIQGGTASDALNKIPSVDVDIDGNISLRGDQNVNVLI